jgi:hypothetical protein
MMAMTTKSSTSVNADRVGRADRADRIEESNRIFRFMPSHPMVQVVSGFAFSMEAVSRLYVTDDTSRRLQNCVFQVNTAGRSS